MCVSVLEDGHRASGGCSFFVSLLEPSLYVIVLVGAYFAGSAYLSVKSNFKIVRYIPRATLTLVVFLTITLVLQVVFPVLLTLFERDSGRFLAGDWWRLVTPLFFQDGGVAGGVFNLVSLLLVGSVAEQLWGSRRWLLIFFVSGILSEVVAFAWQPVGAGNSVANFGLAASVGVLCLLQGARWQVRAVVVVSLVAGAFLLVFRDVHGAATLIGAGLGLGLFWLGRDTFAEPR